eukprot:1353347-Pyramimonas_sp.AAC.1
MAVEFQPYKVVYASQLAELGHLVEAMCWCESAARCLKAVKAAGHIKHTLGQAAYQPIRPIGEGKRAYFCSPNQSEKGREHKNARGRMKHTMRQVRTASHTVVRQLHSRTLAQSAARQSGWVAATVRTVSKHSPSGAGS